MYRAVLVRRIAVLTGAIFVLGAGVIAYIRPDPRVLWRPAPSSSAAPVIPSAGSLSRLRDFQALSASSALVWITQVPGNAPRLYMTSDGGASWAALALPTLASDKYGFQAIDSQHVALQLSRGLLTTQDAGRSWRAVHLPPGQTFGLGARFLDPTNGWYLDLAAYPDQVAQPSSMWWTTDGGETWSQLWQVNAAHPAAGQVPLDGSKYVQGFRDHLNGWLSVRTQANAQLLRTRDGGHSWTLVQLPLQQVAFFEGMEFLSDGAAVLLARSGTNSWAIISPDGGETWLQPRIVPRVPAGDQVGLDSPAFSDRSFWMVASGLSIKVTSNGGRTWTDFAPHVPSGTVMLRNLWFRGQTGWATATDTYGADHVLRTADGGKRWSVASVPGLS